VEVYAEQTEPGVWKATGEFAGKAWSITGNSANRAVSDWAVAVSRLDAPAASQDEPTPVAD
jgi:hypothetical protein